MQGLSQEQDRELNRLMALANLQRIQKRWVDAEDTCRKALELAPKFLPVHELLVDILQERGKLGEALVEARTALELAPDNAAIEKKYAKLVLSLGEIEHEKQLAMDMLANPHKYVDTSRNPTTALICATIPGLGQLYNHEFIKAGVVFGGFVLFVIVWALFPTPLARVSTLPDLFQYTNPTVLVFGFLMLLLYIYGFIDAGVSAQKHSKADVMGQKPK